MGWCDQTEVHRDKVPTTSTVYTEEIFGMVGVNVPTPVPVGYYSFGGWKNSLFGDRCES